MRVNTEKEADIVEKIKTFVMASHGHGKTKKISPGKCVKNKIKKS